MFNVTQNQTIALTGLYQSLALVQNIAWDGNTHHSCMAATIGSVLKLDANSYIDVYGSSSELQLGIQTLRAALQNKSEKRTLERTRYAINLMYLASKFEENTRTLSSLGGHFERIGNQFESIPDSIDEITQELGSLYREHISPLGPKLIIEGDPVYLKNSDNASKIRALLLAGIRAIILWKQAGGKRWALLFARKSLLNNIIELERTSNI